ncbi:hypothetical protein L596_020027 [Steinernema carpocapsae]|uniref:Peptidase S54 rhomboid domain-containing protein n=1 Tax=Steinernema carpocapsae TaxID=34508 RepID=A0A4U5MSI8_STECR|nr:hypothetical protein L596_020027 [Steinernema carpocapsae]
MTCSSLSPSLLPNFFIFRSTDVPKTSAPRKPRGSPPGHAAPLGRTDPPVTLGSILFQVAVYLGFVPAIGPNRTQAMCLLPNRILHRKEWIRLIASQFMHADDFHLYYNMMSMLYKGRRIEQRTGPIRFLLMLAVFSIATPLMILGLSYFVDELIQLDGFHMMGQCAVGFSGVLFALKVVVNTMYPEENGLLLGFIPIPGKYACWAELVLIQMITPNASFVGHLAGILVGLLYTAGPLKAVVDAVCPIVEGVNGYARPRPSAPPRSPSPSPPRQGRFYGFEGTLGSEGRTNNDDGYARRWRQYAGGQSEEEQIAEAMRRSRNEY